MRVLIGCKKSGVVRRAFSAAGHFAISVDLEPAQPAGTPRATRKGKTPRPINQGQQSLL